MFVFLFIDILLRGCHSLFMAKKKTVKHKAARPKKVIHRTFRPSYNAHPIVHLVTVLFVITLLAVILSYIMLGMQNPALFA